MINAQQNVKIDLHCDGVSTVAQFNSGTPPISNAPTLVGGVVGGVLSLGSPTSVTATLDPVQIGEDPVNGAIYDNTIVQQVTLALGVLTIHFSKPPLQTGSTVTDQFGNTFVIPPYSANINFIYNSLS